MSPTPAAAGPGAPRPERFTTDTLGGVRLHVLHWGDAGRPLLVLLHGGGANAHWWDHLAPRLAREFHVAALDFRGHGDSDYPDELVVGAFDEDLAALLAHLGPPRQPLILIGHSMGAGVAVAYAAAPHGASVRALVLVDLSRGASQRARRGARLALALRRTYESRDEAIARYRFLPASDHAEETLRLGIARHSVREERDGRWGFKFDPRWFQVPARPRPDLSRVSCPTLLLRGSESPMLTQEGALALCAELPDARCATIEGAGHHVHLDRPGEFLVAVEEFLAEVREPGAAPAG